MNILEGMAWSAVAVRALAISNQWHFSLEWQIFFFADDCDIVDNAGMGFTEPVEM